MGSWTFGKHRSEDQHGRLAAHDERERKNGDYLKILLIELVKSFDFVPA